MKRWGKRLLSLVLALVLTVTMLPTTAFAALAENSRAENQAILDYLSAILGDELTQEQADALLAQLKAYGLLDKDGNIITDWAGEIIIQDDPQPLTFDEALALRPGTTVTVNGQLCDAEELRGVLETLAGLGLLSGNALAADWALAVNGRTVAPAGLAAAIEAAQAAPGETAAPEESTPAETEPPAAGETPAAEESTPAETETPAESGGFLASIARFLGFGGGADQTPAASVTVLGGTAADADALLEAIAFLEQYDLLTGTGAAADWNMALPGESRKISRAELEELLAAGEISENAVVAVDGTQLTVGNLMTILKIETELQRIQETYFRDEVEMTEEQALNLLSILNQLAEDGGFTLYDNSGADALDASSFPSGVDQTVTISANGAWADNTPKLNSTYTVTVKLNKAQNKDVTFSWRAFSGSVAVTGTTSGSGAIEADDSSTSFTVTVGGAAGLLADGSSGAFVVQIYDVKNALFQNTDGTKQDSWTQTVRVTGTDPLKYEDSGSASASYSGLVSGYSEMMGPTGSDYMDQFWGTIDTDKLGHLVDDRLPLISHTFTFQELSQGTYEATLTLSPPITLRRMDAKSFWEDAWNSLGDGYTFRDESLFDYGFRMGDDTIASNSSITVTLNSVHETQSIIPANVIGTIYDHSGDMTLEFYAQMQPYGFRATRQGGAGNDFLAFLPEVSNTTITMKVQEVTSFTTATVSAPDGEFTSGQIVPITVTFGFPLKITSDMTITVNGEELTPVEAGATSNHATYLYEVPETGNSFLTVDVESADETLDGTGANDRHIDVTLTNQSVSEGGTTNINADTKLGIPRLTDAIGEWDADVTEFTYTAPQDGSDPYTAAEVVLTMTGLPEDATMRDLLGGSYLGEDGSTHYSTKLAFSTNGGETLIPIEVTESIPAGGDHPMVDSFSAQIELDVTDIDPEVLAQTMSFVAELYATTRDEITEEITSTELLYGHYVSYTVEPPVPLTADDIDVTIPEDWPKENVFVNDPPENLTLSASVLDATRYTWSQIRWYSSNEDVAEIDPDTGKITLFTPGEVDFYVRAVNGGVSAYQPDSIKPGEGVDAEGWSNTYCKWVAHLSVGEGDAPYLLIPEETISVREGEDVTVRWASNLVQKNAEYAENATTEFTIEVYSGTNTEADPIRTETVTYNPADKTDDNLWTGEDVTENGEVVSTRSPNLSYTLKGLNQTSAAGGVSYTVKISAAAAAGVPGVDTEKAPGRVFSDTVGITVLSRPVQVKLNRPDSFYVTNSGTLTLGYTLTDFDAGNAAEFELVVTDNATGNPVLTVDEPDSSTGGTFTINLSDAEITDDFRTIYDVSLKAKNTAEPDWSRDSFTLYIYDDDALQIEVETVTRTNKSGGSYNVVAQNGDTVTMSNEDWIASLTQEEILDLNRDIDLQAKLTINYDQFPWGEASDRIKWSTPEDNDTAAINYPQGAYYEDIEGLPYGSYAPATEFLLSGKNNGETVVEAIHALAGDLSDSVAVTVETLKDKLYLFQFYPVGKATFTYYTLNDAGQREERTGESDAQGRAAVYEANGIVSDVYVEAEIGGEKYLGTVYQEDLVSQEKDAVTLELYPLNSLTMRKAASLPIYLKTPDGKPYSGEVYVRAGVYRNGEWCEEAYVDTRNNKNTSQQGKTEDYQVKFENGVYTFEYDLTQFSTDSRPDAGATNPVTAEDDIQFVLELRPVNGDYYPVLFSAYGSLNEDDAVRMAQRVVTLETVPEGQKDKPFIVRQALYYTGEESGVGTSVRNKSGKVGPSAAYPDTFLATTVFWWGEKNEDPNVQDNRTIRFTDSTGTVLEGQTTVGQEQYPFCSMPVSHNTVPLDEDQLNHLGIGEGLGSRYLELQYIDDAGTVVREETMPWKFVNALDLTDATSEDSGLLDKIGALHKLISGNGSDGVSVGNDFLTMGIVLATEMNVSLPGITMTLAPTSDPTTFRGLISVGANNIENDNVSGIAADGSRGSDLDTMPGLEAIKGVYNQGLIGYSSTANRLVSYALDTLNNNIAGGGVHGSSVMGDRRTMYALQGWFEIEVTYDYDNEGWDFTTLTGGFNAGGGMGYEWTWNFQVGPVPMVFQLEAGAAGVLSFTSLRNPDYGGEDYLTELRLYAYLQAFGGIGFDYAVIALKLGLYGRIGLDASLKWLNSANDEIGNKDGQRLKITGEIGAKFQVEVLFISYEKILWSQKFSIADTTYNQYNEIGNYWDRALTEAGSSEEFFRPDATNSLPSANLLTVDSNGTAIYSADLEASLLDRDYLDNYQRSYDASGPSVDTGSEASGGVGLFRSARNAVGAFFSSIFGGDTKSKASIVESLKNSYTQANPVLTDDGEYMFYLSDKKDPDDATAVRVAVMTKNGAAGYSTEESSTDTLISDAGFGDSGVSASGSGEQVAVVWSRVMEKPNVTEPGQSVTPDIQARMIATSDVFVAVPDVNEPSGWKVTNLCLDYDENGEPVTDEEGNPVSNGVGDLSPVVARKGSNILVAWRQVASSDATNVSNFNARDYIYYAVSTDGGKNWSQPRPLYNGTSGSVKGIEAAMLNNGTAAVAFTLEREDTKLADGLNAQSVAYAVIDLNQVMEEDENATAYTYDPKYVVMEDDNELAENPQLATVTLDGRNVFVLGWHSTTFAKESSDPNNSSGISADIRLAAIDGSGNRVANFVDSLGSLIENTGVSVSADFQFVQNADSLDQLSILWSDTAGITEQDSGTENGSAESPAHDVIYGLRFRTDGDKVSVTAAQRLIEMPEWTTVDSFTAYVAGDGTVYAVAQGTYYNYSDPDEVSVTVYNPKTGAEETKTVSIAGEETSIYTAAGSYTDAIRVDSVIPDYANIRKGVSVPVQIGITNLGTQPLSRVTVTIGGNAPATFGGGDAFVPIAPGQSRTLTVYYTVPSDGAIPNPKYTITGTFGNGGTSVTAVQDALLVLNVPDLGIADTDILVAAEDGCRTLQFTLFNNSDAELAGSGRSVKLGIYSDATCTNPIDAQYISENVESSTAATTRDGNSGAIFTIDSDDLAQIDEGSYTVQYRFNLAEYLKQTESDGETPFADDEGEVRDAGVTLYAKVWVEGTDPTASSITRANDSTTGELQEYVTSNNSTAIKLESLLKQADDEPVTITTRLSRPSGGGTQVEVTLRNNSIAKERTGSVIVTLLDQAGGVLEQKKVSVADGAVTLGIEQTLTLPAITFTASGASVLVSYLDPVTEPANADLNSLGFSSITGVSLTDSFQEDTNDPNTLRASVSVLELTSSAVVAVAKNESATITVTNDAAGYRGSGTGIFGETVPLVPGQTNTITIRVSLEDGATKTYILTVQNDERPETGQSSGGSSSSRYSVHVEEEIAHGSVTVSPQRARSGQTVTITAAPDQGWQVGGVTVTTAAGREIAVKQTGENTYTFTMPNSAVYVDVEFVEAGTAWVNPFTDVAEGAWYYDAVRYVCENGLMNGTGDGATFEPGTATSRAMAATILWRMEGSPVVNYLMDFDDVAEGTWYTEAVRWAASEGIVDGYGNGLFGPDDSVTREQLAAILFRYAKSKGLAADTLEENLSGFADSGQVGAWAVQAMNWAVGRGLIQGTGAGLNPQGSASRAELATILMRFCETIR